MEQPDFSANLRGRWKAAISAYDPIRAGGRIVSSRGLMLTCKLAAAVNDSCEILTRRGSSCLAEVVGFSNDLAYLFLYENDDRVRPNMAVASKSRAVPGCLAESSTASPGPSTIRARSSAADSARAN
jgi:flagellar biosynthesis/type III secretory pathway ATPase